MGMMSEFKEFAVKGNALDMAVGLILGAAMGKIVSSLVADVLMPVISMAMGGVSFSNLFKNLGDGTFTTLAAAQEAGAATLNYGMFIQAIIDFLIIAFVIFMIVRTVNKMKKAEEEEDTGPSAEDLLTEIRDSLAK